MLESETLMLRPSDRDRATSDPLSRAIIERRSVRPRASAAKWEDVDGAMVLVQFRNPLLSTPSRLTRSLVIVASAESGHARRRRGSCPPLPPLFLGPR
jgi:hypothetical protein